MADEKCETCRFWHTPVDGIGKEICRRFPPVAVSEMFKDPPYPEPTAGVWPVTGHNDWCGEWEASRILR